LAACVEDYSRVINTLSWYKDALPFVNGPADEFLRHILPAPHEPGWATDPDYFDKVKAAGKVIEQLGGPKWV
jgi:flagellum-specific peptidoglycan hydrolase FlgJ